MAKTFDQLLQMAKTLETELQSKINALREEENESQSEYDNWESQDEDERNDEPDVIDHGDCIGALEDALSAVENVIEHIEAAEGSF